MRCVTDYSGHLFHIQGKRVDLSETKTSVTLLSYEKTFDVTACKICCCF